MTIVLLRTYKYFMVTKVHFGYLTLIHPYTRQNPRQFSILQDLLRIYSGVKRTCCGYLGKPPGHKHK